MISTWRFRPLDTLFFRDSRPHGGAGAVILRSLFPPSARTVAGAVRFLLGNALAADWRAFGEARAEQGFKIDRFDLLRLIGRHDDYGALRFTGPWLAVRTSGGWQRLFPAVRTLTTDESGQPVGHLRIGPAVDCDLGRVYLPTAPEPDQRPADRMWLVASSYADVMAGRVPSAGIYPAGALFEVEPRLGIARDLDQHTAEHGMLYQTLHVRPRDAVSGKRYLPSAPEVREVAVEMGVTCAEKLPTGLAHLVRLGGEGRLAGVDLEPGDLGIPPAPAPTPETLGLVLALITPADLGGSWLPPGFSAAVPEAGRPIAWRGELAGVSLTIHSAVIGPVLREGGWDLAARQPRPVRSLVPAGSAWYATVHDASGRTLTGETLRPAIRTLHGAQMLDDPLGLGHLAVGLFDATHFPYLEVAR